MTIKLQNIKKTYEKDGKKKCVLSEINYMFSENTFYVIMGKSGSGKSTLINIMAGILEFDSGEILYDNQKYVGDSMLSKLRNESIGLMYQSYLLNDNMTAIENVLLPLYLNKNMTNVQKINYVKKEFSKLKMEDKIMNFPKELSGGEQQRVALIRALINNPKIILADEPTGNLDKDNERMVFEILRQEANNGKCVVVVSHNPKIIHYADVVLYLNNGELYEK